MASGYRTGGKADRRRGKSIIFSLLEALIRIIDATQELEFTYIGSRRRDYVESVCESIRSNQWFAKKHEPILDGWEESDIDSDLAESLYNESEAEWILFLVTNLCGLLRSTQRLVPNLLFCQLRLAASSTDFVAAASSDSETKIVQVEESLQPLPPPLQEYLIDWEYLRQAGVATADPIKGEINCIFFKSS